MTQSYRAFKWQPVAILFLYIPFTIYLQFEQTFFTIVFYTKERKELMQTTFFHNTRRTGKFSVRLLLFRDVLLEALSTGIPEMCVLHKTAFHIFQSLCTLFQTPMLL